MAALPFELPFILSNGPGVDRPSSSANQFSKAIPSARTHTANNTDIYKRMNNLKADLYKALLKIPEDQLTDAERATRDSLADLPEITILQMIYQQKAYEGDSKDHEFSATSMREHWQSGLEDTRRTLKRRDWLALPEQGMGIVVHDVHRERDY
jgi:NTE family protein